MNLVSVYMTVKNGYPFIQDSIDSIRSQTYKNWEMVVVDDGSADETTEYLKKLESEDERFKFIYTDGIGRAKALNLAVSHCKGELIANLDADDLAHPERLEKQVASFNDNQDISFLCTRSVIFSDEKGIQWKKGERVVSDVSKKLLTTNPVNHSSVMIKRELFYAAGKYNDSLNKVIDYEFWCRVVLNGGRVYLLNEFLTGKRIHKRQSFENKGRFGYLFAVFNVRKSFISSGEFKVSYHFYNFLLFVYGLIPQSSRMVIKKIVRS